MKAQKEMTFFCVGVYKISALLIYSNKATLHHRYRIKASTRPTSSIWLHFKSERINSLKSLIPLKVEQAKVPARIKKVSIISPKQ